MKKDWKILTAGDGEEIKKMPDKPSESISKGRIYGEGMLNNLWNGLSFSLEEDKNLKKQSDWLNNWYAKRKAVYKVTTGRELGKYNYNYDSNAEPGEEQLIPNYFDHPIYDKKNSY